MFAEDVKTGCKDSTEVFFSKHQKHIQMSHLDVSIVNEDE